MFKLLYIKYKFIYKKSGKEKKTSSRVNATYMVPCVAEIVLEMLLLKARCLGRALCADALGRYYSYSVQKHASK